ncbi:MAG: hypothetical protein WKF37_22700 [Bryobacteraceae bacterium]
MTVTLELSLEKEAALKEHAQTCGLTIHEWLLQLVEQAAPLASTKPATKKAVRSPQEAVARILELQKHVKPDPEGWTVRDYINFGRL